MALAAPNITAVQRSRFQARLDEVREVLFSSRKRRNVREQEQRGQASSNHQSRRLGLNPAGTISR
jgi:hypothetical protein